MPSHVTGFDIFNDIFISTFILDPKLNLPNSLLTLFNMRPWAIFASLVLPFVLAQSNSSLDLDIKAIEAHFNQSRIVPDFLAKFQPKTLLDVNFGKR